MTLKNLIPTEAKLQLCKAAILPYLIGLLSPRLAPLQGKR